MKHSEARKKLEYDSCMSLYIHLGLVLDPPHTYTGFEDGGGESIWNVSISRIRGVWAKAKNSKYLTKFDDQNVFVMLLGVNIGGNSGINVLEIFELVNFNCVIHVYMKLNT